MENKPFSIPQRQSLIGVALIFFQTLYKLVRGFWILAVLVILKPPAGPTLTYILLGTIILFVVVLIYSYLYYRNFLFHINYEKEEFILQKGVFATENLAIPFDKIQQVYFKRSIVQRVLNIYSVVIDTAGSKSDEVNISAISREDANLLSSILTDLKNETPTIVSEENTPETDTEVPSWTFKLTIPRLLIIGITTNYLRGFALIIAFLGTIYNEMNTFFADSIENMGEYYDAIPDYSDSSAFVIGLMIIALLIVSILITVFEVFIKYFGLTLIQTPKRLELEMGLKTNTRVALQPRRVQLVQIITNPVQRKLNIQEARIALASSENALHQKKIRIPGLNKETVSKMKSFLYGDESHDFEKVFRPHKLVLIRRLLLSLIPILISYLLLIVFNYTILSTWSVLAVIYFAIVFVFQFLGYKALELKFTNEFLYKKQGVWSKKEESFEIYKMQAFTVKQPFWYKRRNLVNVYFHTAGGDVSFRAVNKNIITYLNYILYKVESTNRRWM